MRSSLTSRCTLGLAVLVFASSWASAKELGPVLDVITATGETTFHIGERIPLKLTFTNPNDAQYGIAPWNTGRGGEFDFERFDVSPSTGWSDPLTSYFAQDFLRTGHGWSWPPLLKSKPVEIAINLNQWVRFDEPGVYRVKVVSHRVGGVDGLQSNAIDLHIVPATAEWQDGALKRILPQLDSNGAAFEGAVADLRYLATSAAIDVMTGELRKDHAFIATECSMGLLGLPSSMRDLAIASLNHRIDEPDFPISPLFFRTMSLLQVSSGATAEGIRLQLRTFEAVLWQILFSSISKKEPVARAETVQTLLGYGRNISTAGIKSEMASLLSASFLDLDERSQVDDLRQHWDLLRSPGIVPALQILVKRPTANYGDAALGPDSSEDFKSAAFKRWYELDPAGARNEILAQIGSAAPPLSSKALTFLPAEPLPQFESLWTEAFVRSTDQLQRDALGSLLVKFGTGAATSQMVLMLNQPPGPYSCMSRAMALAYLVRFSPDDAHSLLKREIATNEAGCNYYLLQWVSEQGTARVLNEVAVEALNKADPGTVLDALAYLKSYGTKSDETAIWDRYVKWTQNWSGKADILDRPEPGLHPCEEVCMGEELGTSLISSQGWFADPTLISRVLHRCVGKQVCERLKDVARSAAPPYQVILPNTADPLGIGFVQSYNVAQYAPMSRNLLDAKINQYPSATNFVLVRTAPLTDDQRKLEDEVQAIFKKNGMSLEKPAS
jgi:hypothetical protein